jgi:hypothetical protein
MQSQGADVNRVLDPNASGLVSQLQSVKLDDGFKNVIQQSGALGTVLSDTPSGAVDTSPPSSIAQWGQKLVEIYNANAQSVPTLKLPTTTSAAPVVPITNRGDQQSLGNIPQPTMIGMVVNELQNQGLSAMMQNAVNQLSGVFLG